MKVAPLYWGILKRLRKAADTRPHYLQDVRFILSLPLITAEAVVEPRGLGELTDRATVSRGKGKDTGKVKGKSKAKAKDSPDGDDHERLRHLLQRSPAECYPVDKALLLAACREDLRRALDGPTGTTVATTAATPEHLARLVETVRALRWLQTRLDTVLSTPTTAALVDALAVGEGRLLDADEDFIPDTFFEKLDVDSHHRLAAAGAVYVRTHGGTVVIEETASSTTEEERQAAGSGAAGGAAQEDGGGVLVSAGAIGLQREMFSHRYYDEGFPVLRSYLRGFGILGGDALASARSSNSSDLASVVRDRLPTTVRARDANVEAVVSLEPFDPEYVNHVHAARGYFANAHRLFFLHVKLTALNRSGRVQLVNTHLFMLDVPNLTLVEEAGLMPAEAVMQLIHERDLTVAERQKLREDTARPREGQPQAVGGPAPSVEAAEQEPSDGGDEMDAAGSTHSSPGEGSGMSSSAAHECCGHGSSSLSGNSLQFNLLVRSPVSVGPVSLKGLLYYKTGTGEELLHEPVQVLPFGQLLVGKAS